jgi:hypothetical protein
MSLRFLVDNVCRVVGVHQMPSVINNTLNPRTAAEMLYCASEMAQRIAYDTREWNLLKKTYTFVGDGVLDQVTGIMTGTEAFNLPADFKRMLLTSQVWRSTSALQPMVFYPDTDQYLQRRAAGYVGSFGEWTIYGGKMHIWPIMSAPVNTLSVWKNGVSYAVNAKACDDAYGTASWKALVAHISAPSGTFAADRATNPTYWTSIAPVMTPAVTARFSYLDKNCISLASGGFGDHFISDDDTFRLDERLLALGMIWQWKAWKGSPYAEDMGTYEDALRRSAGADSPAPVIIDRLPISQNARVAFPWSSTWP